MAVTVDSVQWEKLIGEKQYSHALTKASPSSPPDLSRVPGRFLRRTPLAQTLYAFGAGSSRSLRLLGASIWRKIADLQVEAQLRRLAARTTQDQLYRHGDSEHNGAISVRSEWLQLQSVVLQGQFSTSIKCRVIQLRAQFVSTQLSAQVSSPPSGLYEDLLQVVSVICSYPLPNSLQRQVWDILLRELPRGSTSHLVAAVDPQDNAVLVILRHLAACKLAAWKTIPSQHSLVSTGHAKSIVRRQSFSWDTYDKQMNLTTGFYDFLLGLLERFPDLVHTAFDENHVHLLWLPKYMAKTGTYTGMIEMSYVLDDLSYWYHDFAKRLNAALSHEHDLLVHFLATDKDDILLKGAVEHLRAAIIPLSHADSRGFSAAVHDVYSQHPGLKDPDLLHPALPFMLFAAHLLPHSVRASELLLEGGLVEALRDLWVKDFPITNLYSKRWVPKEKCLVAMQMASVLALGAMASHSEFRPRLAARLIASEASASWFWDIAAHALYLQLNPTATRWSACYSSISSLAFLIMETTHKLPGDYDLPRRLEDPQSLVWIFQTCSNSTVDRKLREFSLDCLMHLAAQPADKWSQTLYILCSCNRDNMGILEQALSYAIQHCISRKSDSLCSLSALHELIISRKLFMTNPFDRFVMLMSSASRKNASVSLAFAKSGARHFVDSLEEGRFDTSQLDESSASWRARTCYAMRLKLLDTDQ